MSSLNEIFEDFANGQGDNDRLYRNRPYKGQPQTDSGARGQTEIKGITFRDLRDCFILAAFQAANDQLTPERYAEIKAGKVCLNDIYKLDLNKLDPLAWAQNMSCNVEKMMGIYPNVAPLVAVEAPKAEACPECIHEWDDHMDSQSGRDCYCIKCQMAGERQDDGTVFYPAT